MHGQRWHVVSFLSYLSFNFPHSKWEKEECAKDEQNEGDVKPQDPFPVGLPPPNMETQGESEVKRQRSVDTKRDRNRVMHKVGEEEKEKHFTLSTLDRHVAPSSGKITTDSTLYLNREREERRTEMERCRDRERGRDSERSGDRHRETRRAKEVERGRERRPQKKTHPSSSHSSPYSTSQDMERRDRQRRDDHRKSPAGKHSGSGNSGKSSTGGATKVPDKHKTSAYRDRKPKDKNQHHDNRDQRDATGNRPAGSHHSSPSLPHCKQRDPLKSSPGLKSMLKRSRDENKEEWKREMRKREAESGSHYKSTAEKWEGGVVEEGERPSSSGSSSPAGQESSREDRRKERKKREKNEAAVEPPEERELKEHQHKKKPKRGKDGREAESGGDMDTRGKEEDDHTEMCSAMLF